MSSHIVDVVENTSRGPRARSSAAAAAPLATVMARVLGAVLFDAGGTDTALPEPAAGTFLLASRVVPTHRLVSTSLRRFATCCGSNCCRHRCWCSSQIARSIFKPSSYKREGTRIILAST